MTALGKIIDRSKRERESWRYTDVEKILSAAASPKTHARANDAVVSLDVGAHIVFVNGVWQPDQSNFGDLPKTLMKGDAQKGYELTLEGQTCLVTQPIELLFTTTDEVQSETITKLRVSLGANGRLTLIERHENKATNAHVMETEIVLQAQAKLVHGKMIANADTASHFGFIKVDVAEGGYYDNFTLIKGGRLARNEIEVTLGGPLAQCALNGGMLLRGREHADTTTRIIHAAPHGNSRQVYKTVLGDQSRGVFQGKIIVAEGAQKTDGYQMSRALLLSDQAEMDAKPELEIYADDVKCSHGSTVGDLDADALFYLRARGLSEEAARGLLVRAFVDEIVDEIRVPEWHDFCRAEVQRWLDGK